MDKRKGSCFECEKEFRQPFHKTYMDRTRTVSQHTCCVDVVGCGILDRKIVLLAFSSFCFHSLTFSPYPPYFFVVNPVYLTSQYYIKPWKNKKSIMLILIHLILILIHPSSMTSSDFNITTADCATAFMIVMG